MLYPVKKPRLTMPVLRRLDHINRMFNAHDDVMVVETNTATIVSLTILGEPLIQPRMRCYKNPVTGRPVVFDPARDEKLAFKRIVREALGAVGATTFPLFDDGVKLKVTATFHVVDMRKDIDNLLKFLLDALASVVYNNDNAIDFVVAKKVATNVEYTKFMVENIVEGEN
jgi:Holliday junction resolvase RusA-like endonuclease